MCPCLRASPPPFPQKNDSVLTLRVVGTCPWMRVPVSMCLLELLCLRMHALCVCVCAVSVWCIFMSFCLFVLCMHVCFLVYVRSIYACVRAGGGWSRMRGATVSRENETASAWPPPPRSLPRSGPGERDAHAINHPNCVRVANSVRHGDGHVHAHAAIAPARAIVQAPRCARARVRQRRVRGRLSRVW